MADEAVLDPIRGARVLEAARQPLGDAEVTLNLGQEQNPASESAVRHRT